MNPGDFIPVVLQLAALLVAVVFHEVAHGLVAYRLGDPTAKSQKRLSLNPIRHIDPIGTIALPAMLAFINAPIFGFAKPVPVVPAYFRNPYKGMMWVAIAGPLTNFGLAALTYGVLWGLGRINPAILAQGSSLESGLGLMPFVVFFLIFFFIINVILGAFNLIPIPPMDGSRVLAYFLPASGREMLLRVEQFGMLIVLGVVMLGGFRYVLGPIYDFAVWALRQI